MRVSRNWVQVGIMYGCLAILILAGCRQHELFEKLATVPGGKWKQLEKVSFEVNIPDSAKSYFLMATIRHTGMYPYRNIWIRLGLKQPGSDTATYQDFDIPLANSEQWLGTGIGNVYDRRVKLFKKPVQFTRTGTVTFSMEHIMRDAELPGILHTGIRLEPAIP